MQKNLILGLLSVVICSAAVYAADVELADKIKNKTESASSTIQKKADNADAVAQVIGNNKTTEKVSKVSKKAKDKTKKTETKITSAVGKLSSAKSGLAASTTTALSTLITSTSPVVAK